MSSVSSIRELIAHSKAYPGKLDYGTPGASSLQHFAWEMFSHMTGARLVHVPHKGAAQAIAATAGWRRPDRVQYFNDPAAARVGWPPARACHYREKRSPAAPELPTIAEAGVPGYEVDQWYGMVTASKVSPAIVRKLNAGIAEALKSSDVAQRLAADGVLPIGTSPEEFGTHIKSEIAKWRKLVKDTGLMLH